MSKFIIDLNVSKPIESIYEPKRCLLFALFEYILTENSKISFIKSIRKKLANYLKENGDPETPYPLLLIMLDQAQKWLKINCKAKAIRSRM